ncbi:hypothetical protein GCM10009678_45100 [Actinomadura kijaniata]|uniref:zinc ribbon domain-containing protein n=1 Tax=Actinomadura kijaniata TaxID=46161 RepID=UPI002FEBFF98
MTDPADGPADGPVGGPVGGDATVRCPLPRCGADNPPDAEDCAGCGTPVRGHVRVTAHAARLFNEGLAAAREGRDAMARDRFAAVVAWFPADVEARNALALAALRLGDRREARRQWEAVRERRRGDGLAGRVLSLLDGSPDRDAGDRGPAERDPAGRDPG